MSTTDDENAIIIKITNLILLYMFGNININQFEKLECWKDFPRSKNFVEGNSLKAESETRIRNGISFNNKPKIKNIPYSSGKIKKFGGLSKPVNHGESDLSNKPLGDNRKIKPIAMVMCGRAIKGEITIFI